MFNLMEIHMMENGLKIRDMVKEYINGMMGIFILVNGKIIIEKELVNFGGQIKIIMMESGLMIKEMVMA